MRRLAIIILFYAALSTVSCNAKGEKSLQTSAKSTRLDEYLQQCEYSGFNGAVLIANKNEVILNKGYGMSSKSLSAPNSSETVFDICSVTKQFTATAILKLEEDGALKLTDSLGMYFASIPLAKSQITIHQLLTHSAGFGHDIGNGDFDHIPTDKYFKELFDTELIFKPGEKYSYSNSGYSVLGRIIELVSGKDYEQYLKEKLFGPCGMYQTGYLLPDWEMSSVADEYLYNVIDKGNQISRYKRDGEIAWTLKANGGINSSQNDMYKWYEALRNNKVLSKSSMKKLTSPYIAEYEDYSSHYCYGWVTFKSDRNTKVITHNGFNGISYYEFIWFPDEDALVLFATNTFTRSFGHIPSQLEKMLFDDNYIPDPITQDPVPELLKFTESYSGDSLGKILKSNYPELLETPYYLNRLSGIYMRENLLDRAMIIAKLSTELFPMDGNIWDTMGDLSVKVGDSPKAKESYLKALTLAPKEGDCPWCENSRTQLSLLR